MKKIRLPNVTLIAVTSVKLYETIKALTYSMQDIEFGEVVLVTHRKPLGLPKGITYKHTEKITNIDKFNYLMAYELGSYVNTDYIILVHYDGFIVHPEMWRNEFLEYDYIGSPWPLPTAEHSTYYDEDGNVCRVVTAYLYGVNGCLNTRRRPDLNGSRHPTDFIMKISFCAV